LLIEADDAYRASIAACMRLAGCETDSVPDLGQAMEALRSQSFELVVWGTDAGDAEHRFERIAEVRMLTEAPLILIAEGFDTARTDLESGADQRLPKPFVPGALVGSIRAALRKSPVPIVPPAAHVETHGMVLDGDDRRLSLEDRHIEFTRREWDLLLILVSHADRYLGAHDILRLGWQTGDHGPEQVRIYIRRLRRKLDPADLPCRLVSRRGQGYSLTFDTSPLGRTAKPATNPPG
jgi:DNA-binding response OmpR family regulator